MRFSDEAVAAKTGKTWPRWFKLLDAAGAAKWPHPDIARWLYDKQGLSGWWSQMVTVGYEQGRLGRAPHQKADGFEIGVSRTLPVPLGPLFAAWHDERRRMRWLGAPLTVTKATARQSIRGRWEDGTRLAIEFYAKGPRKSQVAVQHSRLKNARTAARMKLFWAGALSRLMGELEAP